MPTAPPSPPLLSLRLPFKLGTDPNLRNPEALGNPSDLCPPGTASKDLPRQASCFLAPTPGTGDGSHFPPRPRAPAPGTAGSRSPELRTSALLSLPRPARLILAGDRGERQAEGRQAGARGHRTSPPGPGPGKSLTSSPVAPRHQRRLNIARVDGVIKRSWAPGEAACMAFWEM